MAQTDGSCRRSIEKYFYKSQVFDTKCDASVSAIRFIHYSKLKAYWKKLREEKKFELIRDSQWLARPRVSGKLLNPGKGFYLLLVVKSVAYINLMVDNDEMPLVRKALIISRLSLNSNWQ